MKKSKDKLRMWQERLARNDSAYAAEAALMDKREALYTGTNELTPVTVGELKKKTPHVRNICAELIEAQVDSTIPQPKVTACRKEDEHLAKIIEDMIRNELDRLPMETINDQMSRTVPIQGGAGYLVEWDNTQCTHVSVGELSVSTLHPKMIIPQDGVYTGIEDMDYIILKLPQTKEYIHRRYGKDVSDESETESDIKTSSGASTADDLVTQYIAYYRNDDGGIGLYSWVNDTELEDLEDYQTRHTRKCKKCGAVEPLGIEAMNMPTMNGEYPMGMTTVGAALPPPFAEDMTPIEVVHEMPQTGRSDGSEKACPYCGSSEWEESDSDYEEIWSPILRSDGSIIPGAMHVAKASETLVDDLGVPVVEMVNEPTKIPFYKPDIYPVILQKNVSVFGKFLGDSDLDKIADQQNTINRLEAKIIEKLVRSGSYISLPDEASIKVNTDDMKVIRPGNPANAAMINVYDLHGDISSDLVYLQQVYEEARQTIGITDSFQGRKDATATSGKAKEFAAAQSAGRLESKRVMKDAAYAALFEAMFKFKLAYTDEPRPITSTDLHGDKVYDEFNRYDFLRQDAAGEWYWNDQFIFACDTTAPLASNREAMWQETRMNLQTGAFGDPSQLTTLILFWTKMETLHYPGASETKAYLQEELQRQQQMAMMQAQQQAMLQAQAQRQQMMAQQQNADIGAVLEQAQMDAARDAMMSMGG